MGDKPMIQLVWEQALKSDAARVIIATDDIRIIDTCSAFGAEAIMTHNDHKCGTDRLAEVVRKLNLPEDAIIVNVQGDEPMIPPSLINKVAYDLHHFGSSVATLAEPILDIKTLFDLSVVKVVTNIEGFAVSFSRSVIPWARDQFAIDRSILPEGVPFRRQIGIYAYRAGFLHDFVKWGICALERTESLEQLRAVWHGVPIHVSDALVSSHSGVDTSEDIKNIRDIISSH